jgi:hypothetical protein
MARLQPHHLGDNHPDAHDRQALRGSGRVLETLHDGLGQGLHRVASTGQDRETAGDGQPLGGLGPPPLECGLRSRRPPLGPETPVRMAPRLLGSLSLWAGCWRPVSRTAHSACGEMSPSGHTPRRNPGANPRASAWSSVYCRLLYGGIAAGLARGTRSSASSNPSTRQSQVEVDSPTTPVRAT